MAKHCIISTPPNPFKKGGPQSSFGKYKHDGEQPQDIFVLKGTLPKPSKEKTEEKKK